MDVLLERIKTRRPARDVIGVDAHKCTHTAAAVEEATGRAGGDVMVPANEDGQLQPAFPCRACWSLPHPWIVRRVGVHGRAAMTDRFGAQLVVPGFVTVDLAEPVRGAVFGQPRRGIDRPDVDGIP